MNWKQRFDELDKGDNYQVWYKQPSNHIRGLLILLCILIIYWFYTFSEFTLRYFHTEVRKVIVSESYWEQRADIYHWEPVRYNDRSRDSRNPAAYDKSERVNCEWEDHCISRDELNDCTFSIPIEVCETLYSYTQDEWVYQNSKNFSGVYPHKQVNLNLQDDYKQSNSVFYKIKFNYNKQWYILKSNREYRPGSKVDVNFWTYNNEPKKIL